MRETILIALALMAFVTLLNWKICGEIEKQGLKSIVERAWEGPKKGE